MIAAERQYFCTEIVIKLKMYVVFIFINTGNVIKGHFWGLLIHVQAYGFDQIMNSVNGWHMFGCMFIRTSAYFS